MFQIIWTISTLLFHAEKKTAIPDTT